MTHRRSIGSRARPMSRLVTTQVVLVGSLLVLGLAQAEYLGRVP
jgi:hypothetical protein